MKAGVSCYCFNGMLTAGEISLAEVIDVVGCHTEAQCIELLSRYWAPARPELDQALGLKDLMDGVGLELSCYTLDSDFAVYDADRSAECVQRCSERVDIALAMGTDTIRIDPRTSLPMPVAEADLDEVLTRMCASMAEVADAALGKGVKVCVENHGRLLGRTAQVARMVELVDRPNFGVNIDPTNFRNVFGEDHVEATRLLAPHVMHVHLKDFHICREPQAGDEWREIPTGEYVKRAVGGEGDAQWPDLVRILQAAGYDGTLSLEISDPADVKGSVARGVANIRLALAQVG